MSVISGELNWSKILGDAPMNEYAGEQQWELDVKVDDDEQKRMVELGIKPISKDKNTFKFKRKLNRAKGGVNTPPQIVDKDKQPRDNSLLIGNGSKGKVAFSTYEHKMMDQHGLGKSFNAVQILEHVPYGGGGGIDEFESDTTDEF